MLSRVDEMILREVDRRGRVRSLFALVVDLGIDYNHAHHRVWLLAARAVLRVERDTNERGYPLVLSRHPDSTRQLTFGWPLAVANGTKERRSD